MERELGIDFGTTTSEVSYVDKNGYSQTIMLQNSKYAIPTALYYNQEKEYVIGYDAVKKGKKNPGALVRNFKLDLTQNVKLHIEPETGDPFDVKPVKAMRDFFYKLGELAGEKLASEEKDAGAVIGKVVLTVPAQFDPKEKKLIKKAAEKAGFNGVRLAAEPTAAAVAEQEEEGGDDRNILVYDLGGGTFDVSIIKKEGSVYKEVATDGIRDLGGNNLTDCLAEWLWNKCRKKSGCEDLPDYQKKDADAYKRELYDEEEAGLSYERYLKNRNEVYYMANTLKEELSDTEKPEIKEYVDFYVDDEDEAAEEIEVILTREKLEEKIGRSIQRTVDKAYEVWKRANEEYKIQNLDRIVLAGGSSQIPMIEAKLKEYPEFQDIVYPASAPTTLISRGAALLAYKELHVEEKTRFEIGTKVTEGAHPNKFYKLIDVDVPLPCHSEPQEIYLEKENQDCLSVEYYEKDVKSYPNVNNVYREGMHFVDEITLEDISYEPGNRYFIVFHIEEDGTPRIEIIIKDKNGGEKRFDYEVKEEKNLE